MKNGLTTSITKIASLFTILARSRINLEEFLSSEGIDLSVVSSPDGRLTLEQVHALTEKAVKLTGDRDIGLHQGEIMTGFSNILGYILLNCATVGEAIEKYCRYQKITDEARFIRTHDIHEEIVIEVVIVAEELSRNRHLIDHKLAGMITYLRLLTGHAFNLNDLHEVRFSYAAPDDLSEYRRIFPCRILFSSPMNALIFDRKILAIPIPQSNRKLLPLFEDYAAEVLSKLEGDDTCRCKVQRIIVDLLQGETPSVEAIARRLAVSVRNLQLKLKEEGTTYSAILDDVRKELAIGCMRDRDLPIAEIAYLLGFSEPSAFHRTFKRWTSSTPHIYRTNILS